MKMTGRNVFHQGMTIDTIYHGDDNLIAFNEFIGKMYFLAKDKIKLLNTFEKDLLYFSKSIHPLSIFNRSEIFFIQLALGYFVIEENKEAKGFSILEKNLTLEIMACSSIGEKIVWINHRGITLYDLSTKEIVLEFPENKRLIDCKINNQQVLLLFQDSLSLYNFSSKILVDYQL